MTENSPEKLCEKISQNCINKFDLKNAIELKHILINYVIYALA